MTGGASNRQIFFPAESELEAASRIFALVGTHPDKARGPKRALVTLARALGLEVDVVATNAVLGRQIARHLDVTWGPAFATGTNQITLAGLNSLLEGASEALLEGVAVTPPPMPPTLLDWASAFRPARSKIEAVNRISALTHSGAETLGPGGKERKSVLVNLARSQFPHLDTTRSKTELAASLCEVLGVPWTDACYSTGYTISLTGLNTILAGAERHLGLLGAKPSSTFATPQEEGAALTAVLRQRLPEYWDGRRCVEEMRSAQYSQWRQMEWPGFYNEFVGLPALNDSFAMEEAGGPVRRFGQTTFDYALGWVWDLKVHSEMKRFTPSGATERGDVTVILNDAEAVHACIKLQGLGFLIVGGEALYEDNASFDDWHRGRTETLRTRQVRANQGYRRRRKAAFTPTRCEAFWIANIEVYNSAIASGHLRIRSQGRQQARPGQQVGADRRDKLHMNIAEARSLRVSAQDWTGRQRDRGFDAARV